MRRAWPAQAWLLACCAACSSTSAPPAAPPGTVVAADPQRTGDAAAGYTALVDNGYVTCGIPWSIFQQFGDVLTGGGAAETVPGRSGHNASLPYWLTATTTSAGVEVVATNCLTCHAGHLNGQLVIGLGETARDFTQDPSPSAAFATQLMASADEHAELVKWAGRVQAIGPYTTVSTMGANPADNLAAVLFAHHDQKTLAWSDAPLLELPPQIVLPVDVPPWWRMKKKHAMFYDAAGRGDHARIMMATSTLCTDSVAEAQGIDAYFPDVRAYLDTLTPPAWPFGAPDPAQVARGQAVYKRACADCHGGAGVDYPNVVIATGDVGTDLALATGGSQFAQRFVDWFNGSFYGQVAHLDPQPGYVAPPLDGIWATAPYLHNGSVPTLAALLDSKTRPQFWTRSFASTDYDAAAVGWQFTAVDHGQADEADAQKRARIYDTTQLGYSNAGHTYGDALSAADRAALLEYLKTL